MIFPKLKYFNEIFCFYRIFTIQETLLAVKLRHYCLKNFVSMGFYLYNRYAYYQRRCVSP